MSTKSRQKRKEPSIPLSQPNRTRPPSNGPTLMEIAQAREREHQIGPHNTNNNKGMKDGKGSSSSRNGGDGRSSDHDTEVMTIFEQSIFLAGTLTMLHFTVDVLVHHQYRQEVVWRDIIRRTAMNFPFILTIIYITRLFTTRWLTRSSSSSSSSFMEKRNRTIFNRQLLPQSLFLITSLISGTYLIHAANDEPYFAVMKRAPPLATLWVWSVIELDLPFALASLFAVAAWLYFMNYTIF